MGRKAPKTDGFQIVCYMLHSWPEEGVRAPCVSPLSPDLSLICQGLSLHHACGLCGTPSPMTI